MSQKLVRVIVLLGLGAMLSVGVAACGGSSDTTATPAATGAATP